MRTARTGMTLVELLIALALALLVIGSIVTTLTRQQRLYSALDDALQAAPRQLDAATLLAADLRTMYLESPATQLASDSTFEVDAIIGASTLCLAPAGNALVLPPRNGDFSNTLTSWNTMPDSDDAALIYHDATPTAAPFWERITIADIRAGSTTGCAPAAAPYPDAAVYEAGPTYELTLTHAPNPAPHAGTPVRFVRHARYSVYRASDGQWYVGYRQCSARSGRCETVQPLVGPFPRASTPPASFRYFTGTGAAIPPNASLNALARVDVVVRRPAAMLSALVGAPATRDSTVTSIALRNRP